MGGKEALNVKAFKLKIKATPKELFNDWNLRIDGLGLIKKLKTYRNVEYLFKELKEERKKRPVYYFFHDIYYRIYHYIDGIPLKIKTFIQRGRKGWANSDTWGFDYYLSEVIAEGVKHLKKIGHHDIKEINKIIYTFETAKKICEGELIYQLPSEDFSWAKYKRMKRTCANIRKKYKIKYRPMTKRESIKFEKGFDVFKKEFFRLWD